MKLKYMICAIGLGALGFVANVQAVPISFSHTGTGSGSIGTTNFSNAFFTINESADTTFRQDCGTGGACFFIDDQTASITIGSLGTFSFVTATRTFVDQDLTLAGFARAGADGADLLDGPTSASLAGYSLLTSIGPVAGSGDLLQFGLPFDPVITSGGQLLFTDSTGPVTFQATVTPVPEPSSMLLLSAGLLGMGLRYHKRKLL